MIVKGFHIYWYKFNPEKNFHSSPQFCKHLYMKRRDLVNDRGSGNRNGKQLGFWLDPHFLSVSVPFTRLGVGDFRPPPLPLRIPAFIHTEEAFHSQLSSSAFTAKYSQKCNMRERAKFPVCSGASSEEWSTKRGEQRPVQMADQH